MLVRIQSSALMSRWCSGKHRTLLRFGPWFEPRSGYCIWPVVVPDSRPPSGRCPDQVQFLDGLLNKQCPAGVMDGMADFESVGRGSIPRRGTEVDLVSVMVRTAVCGTARPGSIPRQGTLIDTSLECAGFAREPAKLVDQVRFLAGTPNCATTIIWERKVSHVQPQL